MRFTLGTWNCFGAAQTARAMILRRGAREPARYTHPAMTGFAGSIDVLCLQELFVGESRDFFSQLPHPHREAHPNERTLRPFKLAGSGLGIACKLPVVAHSFHVFNTVNESWEKLGRKGVAHARVAASTLCEIDVFTTHMQSGYDDAAARVRRKQLLQLRDLVDAHSSPTRATVVCGDFNIDSLRVSAHADARFLADTMHGFQDLFAGDDEPTFDTVRNAMAARYEPDAAPQRVDYIFFRAPCSPGARRVDVVATQHTMRDAIDGAQFASDHSALVVTLDVPEIG
jgi:endonuclease/exonuclease/phosphatase family metal-dependent hydrolase